MKLRKLPEAKQARRHWLVDLSVRLIKTKPLGTGCGIIVLALILVSIFADVLAPYPYDEIRLQEILQPPSAQHLLGTDHVGRDYLSRIIQGARVSMLVGLAATTINVVVAILVGGTTGFLGGKVDLVVQRFVDAWIAFPGLLLLLTLMSVAGRGVLQAMTELLRRRVVALLVDQKLLDRRFARNMLSWRRSGFTFSSGRHQDGQ